MVHETYGFLFVHFLLYSIFTSMVFFVLLVISGLESPPALVVDGWMGFIPG